MSMKDELRRILTIIIDLTHNDINSNVKDTKIIAEGNLQSKDVEKYLKELQSLGLIKEDSSKSDSLDYRLFKITREGINEIYNKEFR
jgi:predicted transcriptional regulator